MPKRTDNAHRIPSPLAGEGGPTVRSGRVRGCSCFDTPLPASPSEHARKASHPSPARGEGLFPKSSFDHPQYAFQIAQHLVVPEPHHAKALRLQPRRSGCIAFGRVLPTVYLDDQSRLEADEIGDIVSKRHLSAEFRSLQLARAQRLPQTTFRIGAAMPHRSGARHKSVSMFGHGPLTPMLAHRPSPARGEGYKARAI